MMEDGYIMLGRSFFCHALWEESRTYSRSEAWLDLIQSVNFRHGKKMIGAAIIEVPRGGIVASVRFLSERWKWSNTKVCQFLDALRAEGMIKTEKRQGITVVILSNYDRYNTPTVPETTQKRNGSDGETTERRRGSDKEEEGNNAKEGEKEVASRGKPVKPPALSDDEWMESLISDVAYKHVDVRTERAKMVRWCEVNHKKPSRRYLINWLNRIEKPMTAAAPTVNGKRESGW